VRKILVPNQKKSVGPLLATLVLVVIAVIIALMVTFWTGVPGVPSGIELTINPKIYSPESNIGVLNEESVFHLYIRNYENYSQEIKTYLKSDTFFVNNQTLQIDAKKSMNVSLSQKLIYPGIWIIETFNEDKILESYSFLVVINKGEADTKINQWNNIRFNKNLSIIAIFLSSISLLLNILQFALKKHTLQTTETSEPSEEPRTNQSPACMCICKRLF